MSAPGEVPFNALVEGVLRWAINALPRTSPQLVTADDLQSIADFLADDAKRRQVFTYARLREFLRLNYDTEIGTPLAPTGPQAFAAGDAAGVGNWDRWSRWCGGAARPSISDVLGEHGPVGLHGFTRSGSAGADGLPERLEGAPEDSSTIFPMIPDLSMGPQGLPVIDFATYNPVGPTYEACLNRLVNQLKIDPGQDVAKDREQRQARVRAALAGAGGAETESLATFLFRDYFGLIAKAAVEAAIQLLKRYPYVPKPFDTLDSIVREFPQVQAFYRPRPHDTLASVALAFGSSPQQLIELNRELAGADEAAPLPGDELLVSAGVSPQSILSANPDYLLSTTGPPHLPLSGVQYQVRSGDSVASAAQTLGLPGPSSFFDPASGPGNSANTGLFANGAQFVIPSGRHFAAQSNDLPASEAFLRAAAFYTTRGLTGLTTEALPYLAWYKQQIVDLNQDNQANIDFSLAGPFAVGGNAHRRPHRERWQPRAGDRRHRGLHHPARG